jgi:hypothetical protein
MALTVNFTIWVKRWPGKKSKYTGKYKEGVVFETAPSFIIHWEIRFKTGNYFPVIVTLNFPLVIDLTLPVPLPTEMELVTLL